MPRIYRHIKDYEKEISKQKDQIKNGLQIFRISKQIKGLCIMQTYEEARLLIGEYIYFYNNERIQLKTKLTPQEMRCQYVV